MREVGLLDQRAPGVVRMRRAEAAGLALALGEGEHDGLDRRGSGASASHSREGVVLDGVVQPAAAICSSPPPRARRRRRRREVLGVGAARLVRPGACASGRWPRPRRAGEGASESGPGACRWVLVGAPAAGTGPKGARGVSRVRREVSACPRTGARLRPYLAPGRPGRSAGAPGRR